MAKHTCAHEHLLEEEYIDMDVDSATFFYYNKSSSPPHTREFEFQMSAPVEREAISSPADELFYKGKLLPLQFSPRFKMVEKLLESGSKSAFLIDSGSKSASATATPFLSCNVSPATSCYVSGELNAEDYFHECYGDHLIENSSSKKPVNSSNKSSSASTSSSSSRSSSNSSSFSSSSSNGPCEAPILKRCSSSNSDLESSIQGAIAYCKKSQQLSFERKSLSDIGLCFLSEWESITLVLWRFTTILYGPVLFSKLERGKQQENTKDENTLKEISMRQGSMLYNRQAQPTYFPYCLPVVHMLH